jgi:hypothetical protein
MVYDARMMEFELGAALWTKAQDKKSKDAASFMLEKACKAGDPRGCLGLSDSEVGHVGRFHDITERYSELVFLSIAWHLSNLSTSNSLIDYKAKFVDLAEGFPKEFLPEIIQKGRKWNFGDGFDCAYESPLQWMPLSNPKKFDISKGAALEILYPKAKKIRDYLKRLPGADDYSAAAFQEDAGNQDESNRLYDIALQKGNGQVIYNRLKRDTNKSYISTLMHAAEYGSPDALCDLLELLIGSEIFYGFKNCLNFDEDPELRKRVNLIIFFTSIVERLGIEDYEFIPKFPALVFDIWNEAGLSEMEIELLIFKYDLCDHEQVSQSHRWVNHWTIRDRFPSLIKEAVLGLSLEKSVNILQ